MDKDPHDVCWLCIRLGTLFLVSIVCAQQVESRSPETRATRQGGATSGRTSPPRTLEIPTAPGPDKEENLPYKTYPTTPVILHGPFILGIAEHSATIEWITDTPCTGKIEYGETSLDQVLEPQENGLKPVGTLHRIELTGLAPGHTYQYKVSSTRVVRLKAYWPDLGLTKESSVYRFTTFSSTKPFISFSVISDAHEDVARLERLMGMIDWKTTDFLVSDGDAVNSAESQDQIFDSFVDPISSGLKSTKPLLFARGNHEFRGPFARELDKYFTTPNESRFYYSRNDGPAHLIVIDTGEDKPDDTNVYAHLNETAPYRQNELAWFRNHIEEDSRVKSAPFRIVLMHQPYWGWLDGKNKEWTDVANRGNIDLAIAGHWHEFAFLKAGAGGNHFPVLVLGQDQVAQVDVSETSIHVNVTQIDGTLIGTIDVQRKMTAQQ